MEQTDRLAQLRDLPPVHRLLNTERVLLWQVQYGRVAVLSALQKAVDHLRVSLLAGATVDVSDEHVLQDALTVLEHSTERHLRPVINATGTVIHTNLGRAPLAQEAVDAVVAVSAGYSNLEYNLASGERGHRYEHVEQLLCELTGAEAALVVNNNAAAVFLVLHALAAGQKVAISRGELVEIGGSFRVSEVMRESGAELVEVGTTNKTYERDYATALEEGAQIVLRVHTSNFRVVGFTYQTPLSDLVQVAHAHDALIIEDLGSGSLIDLRALGIGDEPIVRDSIAAGVDVVMFSGDKLLGGAQAGLICGRADLLERIAKNQVARVVRVDKLTLAALEATLSLYRDEQRARERIPVLRMLTLSQTELREAAEHLAALLVAAVGEQAVCRVTQTVSMAGGGALPSEQLPSYAVALTLQQISASECIKRLRTGSPPVVARVVREEVVFDVRTILPTEYAGLVQCVSSAICR